ncbi:MAG: hypothetical protein WC819_03985 [Parcubacteria group bacterium]|jgi:hypothetical protein
MGKDYCAVHAGNGTAVNHSLALRKEKGVWVTTPVCLKCRAQLARQAKAEGKFVPFYGLEQSEAEAAKRNQERMQYQPFLEKFGKSLSGRTGPAKGKKAIPKPAE